MSQLTAGAISAADCCAATVTTSARGCCAGRLRAASAPGSIVAGATTSRPNETLATFIAEGHLARHVRKMRQVYGARHQTLLSCLKRDFHRWLEPIPSAVGLHLAALSKTSVDVDALADRARHEGIGIYSLREFYFGRTVRPGLVFGYGAIEERDIVEGLSRVRRLLPR